MSFLTVEDVNSTLLNYGNINEFFVLDSAKIPFDDNGTMFFYDFVNIWKEGGHFYLDVINSLWTGGYYFTDKDGKYLPNVKLEYVKSRFAYTIVGNLPDGFKIHLYLTNYHDSFRLVKLVAKVSNLKNFNIRKYFVHNFQLESLYDGVDFEGANVNVKIGENNYSGTVDKDNCFLISIDNPIIESCNCSFSIGNNVYYFFINVLKDNVIFDLDVDLLVGAKNKVKIKKAKNQDLTGVTGSVNINGSITKFKFEDNEFIVDLSNETVPKDLSVIIKVNENEKYYGYTHEFVLKSHYFRPTSFDELKLELEKEDGAPIIDITSDIQFSDNINVNHDVLIKNYGEINPLLNLFGHSLIINENIKFKLENIDFIRGNPAIIQKMGSDVEITGCEFKFCENSYSNNAGSVIYCDFDKNSLSDKNDFITSIKNSLFLNNTSCIYHGGLLTIDNCKFRLNVEEILNYWGSLINYNNVSFLYQVDGDATISNSVFDIDFEEYQFDYYDIGLSQAIVICGKTATINGANHKSLQSDNTLPFFDAPYNNKSHLFVNYYYLGVDAFVFLSPVLNYEDKSCCHAVSGVDWIFKDNVQITREEWGSENTKRTIEW